MDSRVYQDVYNTLDIVTGTATSTIPEIKRIILAFITIDITSHPCYTSLTPTARCWVDEIWPQLNSSEATYMRCINRLAFAGKEQQSHYGTICALATLWKHVHCQDRRPVLIISHNEFFPLTDLYGYEVKCLTNYSEETPSEIVQQYDVVLCSYSQCHNIHQKQWSLLLADGVQFEWGTCYGISYEYKNKYPDIRDLLVNSRINGVMFGNYSVIVPDDDHDPFNESCFE